MGWGGIQNLPPGFDVFGGNRPTPSIVEEAIRGNVKGLHRSQEPLFADLKRNLLHQDYLRYFDSSLQCAKVLSSIEEGRYGPEILRDIIEPALATAAAQYDSIVQDLERSRSAGRPPPYDPIPSLSELHRRAAPIALAYPAAEGASALEERFRAAMSAVSPSGVGPGGVPQSMP